MPVQGLGAVGAQHVTGESGSRRTSCPADLAGVGEDAGEPLALVVADRPQVLPLLPSGDEVTLDREGLPELNGKVGYDPAAPQTLARTSSRFPRIVRRTSDAGPPAGSSGRLPPDTAHVPIWRTKVGGGRVTEHASKDAADAVVDDARRRYQAGARALRVVRIYGPDGGVRLIDFEAEARDAQRALRDVERATARRDREVREAVDRWESVVARVARSGEPIEAIAAAAGISAREVRAVVRRRGGNSRSERR
jgi:hypothetical protein